ncbi:hypothetical protein F4777DRAFT_97163 [Nemania sp. FL0916]|nr:hypothetical protein F4777DRAFT_97163 [Nemania sp. FL0916]
MTAPNSADGESDPAGPQSSQPDASQQNDAPDTLDTSAGDAAGEATAQGENGKGKKSPAAARRRATTMKHPPTLLGDFLLGRPSPARVAAEKKAAKEMIRKRRMSLEAVKQEMREANVHRVQAPGGVRDRVTKWQKANSEAMAAADPFATPSEPSEINIQVDQESVTEEDRVKIKMRQKKRPPLSVPSTEQSIEGDDSNKGGQKKPVITSPPKKRVVSDTNWVKDPNAKGTTKNAAPKPKQPDGGGSPLPKDFLSRPSPNPPVSKKIQEWASKVEIPDEPRKRSRTPRSAGSKSVGSKSVGSNDGIRVKPMSSESMTDSDPVQSRSGITHSTGFSESKTSRTTGDDDGIRVKPLRVDKVQGHNEKAKTQPRTLPDDGIRVRPMQPASRDSSTVRARSARTSEGTSTDAGSASRRRPTPARKAKVEDEEPDEPTMRTRAKAKAPAKTKSKDPSQSRPRRAKSAAETQTTGYDDESDRSSWTSSSEDESEVPSSIPPKSLADIPVGYSAFSELELPRGGSRPTVKPRANRQSSFKGAATNVLKRALTEGKKILAESLDPPKPVVNQPPNIENWLKATVDPFVDNRADENDESQGSSIEEERTYERKARHASSPLRRSSPSTDKDDDSHHKTNNRKSVSGISHDDSRDRSEATPSPSGLRRSQATRTTSSSGKGVNRRGIKEKIRDAFRGESAIHVSGRTDYSSHEETVDDDSDRTVGYQEQSRPSGARRSISPSDEEDSYISTELSQTRSNPRNPKRRPPTKGAHELSTIVSDADTMSTLESELSSRLSESTITQTAPPRGTGLTRSAAVSRKRSQGAGLKRRLTKHSDLISVLSLPDDSAAPGRNRSLRSAHSVRRVSNHLHDATIESLLQEFARDENLYSRELKTLVDGVIPVLLSQFVHGKRNPEFFTSPGGTHKEDPLPKAVVSMGIALEKLKNHHRRCPLTDMHKLPEWLETITPIYRDYLDVWRLGFQGLIVNLAPASPDDEDSLLDAMPRNEQGDILNEFGDRIDVAHLLKRPLVRTKWITKFIQGYQAVAGTPQYESLSSRWQALQERARKRYKEETARIVDEDARKTDTSRTRDLESMEAADNIKINKFRQVYAKDSFSLDLRHSNGQRLNCQVELVYRDNQLFKSDLGDLLIREIGSGGRSWLLFAPITGDRISARKGDNKQQLVVMIRGDHDEWFELITLATDNEEQILDWLQILGSTPMPPRVRNSTMSDLSPSSMSLDMPVGERKRSSQHPSPKTAVPSTKSYHSQHPSSPTRPPPAVPSSHTQDTSKTIDAQRKDSYSHAKTLVEETSEDALYRDDGAPPPPKHRTLDAKKSPGLAPPADPYANLKRRNSSPLKHEYHPSEISSETSYSTSESEDDYSYYEESSDDELEAADMPDAVPAISIRNGADPQTGSVISRSSISSAPSALAPETEISKATGQQPDYLLRSFATISYWDNKQGCWKDLWPDVCCIVTTPGLIEAYPYRRIQTSSGERDYEEDDPLIALDLTPLVMLRTSTALDIEIRSPVLSYARLFTKVSKIETSFFRFRATSTQECESLYMAVHRARLDNAKYKALEEETRIRAFGQGQDGHNNGDGNSQHRSWFGRKNSYRASARAPSQSAGSTSHSSMSASSFLKKLMGGGGQFDIAMSSVHRQSRFASGESSLYTSSSATPPRSPSVSAANSATIGRMSLTTNNLKIRLHLLVSASKWEDYGNCYLEVTRPDQGTRQNLRKYQGMEKRIIVSTIPKKQTDSPRVVLDIVLGSRCFSRLGSRGILLNVWEEVRDEYGEMGVAPKGGGSGGNVSKWCFQCISVMEANWIYGLVTQEVVIA